jgi:hypothetical protein
MSRDSCQLCPETSHPRQLYPSTASDEVKCREAPTLRGIPLGHRVQVDPSLTPTSFVQALEERAQPVRRSPLHLLSAVDVEQLRDNRS